MVGVGESFRLMLEKKYSVAQYTIGRAKRRLRALPTPTGMHPSDRYVPLASLPMIATRLKLRQHA